MVSGQVANNLLRGLRPNDLALLVTGLDRIFLGEGHVLFDVGDDVRFVHFPCGPSLVSFLVVVDGDRPVETALVGREGAVGGIVSQGRLPAFSRAVVSAAGPFLRMTVARLEEAKARSPALANAFARYADCLLAQVFQSVACNAAHGIEARTAKWLLAAMDRTGAPEVPLTQEQLAGMLGVGRSYLSRVLGDLRRRGLVDTQRGRMIVRDARALRGAACGCGNVVRDHFATVLAGVYPTVTESRALGRA